MDEIMAVAAKHGITVIEDAAHSFGAQYKGKRVGELSCAATCFSFYATKNITTAEGGMLTTFDDELADRAAILALHGISADAWKRYSNTGYKHWDIVAPGFKYNMFDLQAALGLCQLKRAEQFWAERKRLIDEYDRAFAGLHDFLKPLAVRDYVKPAYHLYVIQLNTEALGVDRDTFMNALQAENIGIGIHFRAVHTHPYYRETFGFRDGMFPVSEAASDRVVSLPLYPGLTAEEQASVVEAVRKLVAHWAS